MQNHQSRRNLFDRLLHAAKLAREHDVAHAKDMAAREASQSEALAPAPAPAPVRRTPGSEPEG